MTRIKVLHVTFDMRIGGTEQVIKNIIENCDTDSFEMSILCLESPLGPFATELLEKGISITAFSRRPGFDTGIIRKIHSHIQHNRINIVHCHQYTPWVYGSLGALGTKAKVIFTEHGRYYPDSTTWKRRLINPWLHRFTATTTAISHATKNALSRYEFIPSDEIQVIYNGITPLSTNNHHITALRKELGLDDHTLCLGTVARLDPIKNHVMMLKAFKSILDEGIDAKLVIVGDGEMRQSIEQQIAELMLQDRVVMTGYITAPNSHIALMDIYLLSSLSEGTSMTLLEAMSIGKPCVVTAAGGNPEIIENNVNGFVTPNDNHLEFALAIVKLATSPELRQSMGLHSAKIFAERFTSVSMANQYQSLYRKIS